MWLSPATWAQSPNVVRPPLPEPYNRFRPPGSLPEPGSLPSEPSGRSIQAPQVKLLEFPMAWRVISMKLLAPGVGWALVTGRRLYWTTDNGINWKDVTPSSGGGSGEHVYAVFSLDVHHLWVLLSQSGEPQPKFDLAYSGDAGATWSVTHIVLPENEGNLTGGGRIAFADDQHGWMVLGLATSSAFHAGTLLVTSDGGRTWSDALADPSGEGDILLVTPEEGWMAGGAEDEDLYVTRDGAKSWQKVSLPAPEEIHPAIYPTADLPVFEDSKHGFVAVTYSGGSGNNSAAVLFSTDDGGLSWKPDRILANLEDTSLGQRLPSAVTDSTWITSCVSHHKTTVTVLGAGGRARASIDPVSHFSGYFSADQLSFASAKQGWIIVDDGDLRSTTDGGATWTDVTPGSQPHIVQPQAKTLKTILRGDCVAGLLPVAFRPSQS
jgi:photosystem II stability/assembly factor-like uncharacterized protein